MAEDDEMKARREDNKLLRGRGSDFLDLDLVFLGSSVLEMDTICLRSFFIFVCSVRATQFQV